MLSSVFWFAELRKQVDPADWDAMLADYVAIYSSSTVQEVNEAIQRFGEHWGEKYADIVSRLTSQSATPEQIVAVCDAFREQKISIAQVIDWLVDDLEGTAGDA